MRKKIVEKSENPNNIEQVFGFGFGSLTKYDFEMWKEN